jgi:hypothetical protein
MLEIKLWIIGKQSYNLRVNLEIEAQEILQVKLQELVYVIRNL